MKKSAVLLAVSISALISVGAESKPADLLDSIMSPKEQQAAGIQKLTKGEKAAYTQLIVRLIMSARVGDSAAEYLKRKGWEEIEVEGTTSVKKRNEDDEIDCVVVRSYGSKTYLEGTSLGSGRYLAQTGGSTWQIISRSGSEESYDVVDVDSSGFAR